MLNNNFMFLLANIKKKKKKKAHRLNISKLNDCKIKSKFKKSHAQCKISIWERPACQRQEEHT